MTLRESDIRPQELARKCIELFELDVAELLAAKDRFVEVSCPACDAAESEVKFEKKSFKFRSCSRCRTLFVSPRPTPEMLSEYYKNSRAYKFRQQVLYPSSKDARVEKIYRPRVDRVAALVRDRGLRSKVLVDIGGGSGHFAQHVAETGLFGRVVVVEPGPIELRDPRVEVHRGPLEDLPLRGQADLITNFELIEHLFSPLEFLRTVRSYLAPGGRLLLTCPNIQGFDLVTLGPASGNIEGPDHLNYFNPDSIRSLLERAGFCDIETSTPGLMDCDIVRNRHEEGVIDLRGNPFLHHVLIEKGERYRDAFQVFLRDNGLSSNLQAICRRD